MSSFDALKSATARVPIKMDMFRYETHARKPQPQPGHTIFRKKKKKGKG
jgi:hypothetical protein